MLEITIIGLSLEKGKDLAYQIFGAYRETPLFNKLKISIESSTVVLDYTLDEKPRLEVYNWMENICKEDILAPIRTIKAKQKMEVFYYNMSQGASPEFVLGEDGEKPETSREKKKK